MCNRHSGDPERSRGSVQNLVKPDPGVATLPRMTKNDMDFTMIDEQLVTTHDRDSLLAKLDALSMGIYTKQYTALDSLTSGIREAIVLFLEKNKIDTKKTTSVRNAFADLEKHLKDLPTLTLELAFEPTVGQLKKIAGKIELYGTRPLLQTRLNERMLAGAVLEKDGKRKDYAV